MIIDHRKCKNRSGENQGIKVYGLLRSMRVPNKSPIIKVNNIILAIN